MVLSRAELDAYVRRWQAEHDPDDAVALIEVSAVDSAGRVRVITPGASQANGRRAALLVSCHAAIVERIEGESVAVERVFCDRGHFEIEDGELVIVALAPGVAATELQALAAPTLKISHRVAEMVVERPAPSQD